MLFGTGLNNVVLPKLFTVVNNIVQHCYTRLRADSGSRILFNTVDNCEQCGQHNVVQSCYTAGSVFAVSTEDHCPRDLKNGDCERIYTHVTLLKISTIFCYLQQRLTDEAEMTEGFKTLLKDLHELMSNIKDSSVMLRRGSNATERNIPTAKDVVPDNYTEHRKTTAITKESINQSSRSHDGNNITDSDASTTTAPSVILNDASSNLRKDRGIEFKKKRSTSAPLHSSSPKSASPVFDNDVSNELRTQFDYPYSDISDVESDFSEDKQERTEELRNEPLKSSKARYMIISPVVSRNHGWR